MSWTRESASARTRRLSGSGPRRPHTPLVELGADAQPAAAGSLSPGRWDGAFVRLLPLLGLLVLVSVVMGPRGSTSTDEGPILAAAHRLLEGHYAVIGTMDATRFLWHGPGLPALLAPLVALRVPLEGLRLTSPLLMFASVLLFYRLLRLRLSRRGALIGAYALGLYAPAYYVLGTVAKDPLALLLSISALDATTRYVRNGRWYHAVIAGLSFGGLAMTRLEYGWVITVLLIAGLLWWLLAAGRGGTRSASTRTAWRWALVCAVGLLACMPWLTYTYAITHHLFYWGNSGGISLYWMSSPSMSQLGQFYSVHTVFTDPALATYRGFFHYLDTLRPLQRDLELQHVAIVQALGHPAKYVLNMLANLGRMFLGFPFGFTLAPAAIAVLIVVNGTLAVGLAAAMTSVIRTRRALPRETVPFLLFGTVSFAVHIFATAEPRLMLPIIPVPIWLIGQAFHRRAGIRSRTAGSTVPVIAAPRPVP